MAHETRADVQAQTSCRPAGNPLGYRGSKPLFRRPWPLKWWLSGSLKLASMDDTLSTLPDADSFRWSIDGDTVKPCRLHMTAKLKSRPRASSNAPCRFRDKSWR